MKYTAHLLLTLGVLTYVLCINSSISGHNECLGNRTSEYKLIHREKVEYNPIPWMKRVKYYEYNDLSQRIIKDINCYDYQKTKAEVHVTDGGIGYTHVTLRFKSERSYGLDFAIEIYA